MMTKLPLLLTSDIAAMQAFFEQAFLAAPGPVLDQDGNDSTVWMFVDSELLVCLAESHPDSGHFPEGTASHLEILSNEDYSAFRARLDKAGISYSLMDMPEVRQRRVLFIREGGLIIEAVFPREA